MNRNGTGSISADAGGAVFTEALNASVANETAMHALYWKVANSSEPSAYNFTFGSRDFYQVIIKVFSAEKDVVVDSAVNVHNSSSSHENIVAGAVNGAVISDNAVSVVFAGKDNRRDGRRWTDVNRGYTGVLGKTDNQDTAAAHKIYTAGEEFIGDITFTAPGQSANDKLYSAHISFVESPRTHSD